MQNFVGDECHYENSKIITVTKLQLAICGTSTSSKMFKFRSSCIVVICSYIVLFLNNALIIFSAMRMIKRTRRQKVVIIE